MKWALMVMVALIPTNAFAQAKPIVIDPGDTLEGCLGGKCANMSVTGSALAVRFTDSEFQPLHGIDIYVTNEGFGAREVWVEVEAHSDDPQFDDDRVDQVSVRVWSDSEPQGETVICSETARDSRLFRSQSPILLRAVRSSVRP
jgi:hypothetical protein